MIKLVAWTVVAVALLALVALAHNQRLYSKYGGAYASVPLGGTEADVRRIAGEPSWVTDGTRGVEPEHPKSASELVPGCVKELWYAMPWPQPLRFSFCFDKAGVLVDKYNWMSW